MKFILSLHMLTGGWELAAALRAQFYRRGFLRQKQLKAKVISVGNLTWGGTGKTPFTLWLAGRLQAAGLRVSILTRGYGRRSKERVKILPPGMPFREARDCGDEAQLYLRHLIAPVGVGNSRYEAGRALEEQFPVNVHLLDDGFQHLCLGRDIDIVLVDASNPWGARWGTPKLLRESPAALRRANCILLTRSELIDDRELSRLKATLRRYNERAEYFTMRTNLICFRELDRDQPVSVAEVRNRRPLAFCALGNPNNFFEMLRKAGIEPVATKIFPDHHRYQAHEIEGLERTAVKHNAACIIMTEKDLINFPESWSSSIPFFWAAIEPVVEGETQLLQWIGRKLNLSLEALTPKAVVSG